MSGRIIVDALGGKGRVTEDEDGRLFVIDNLGIEQEAIYYGGKALGFQRPEEIPSYSRAACLARFKQQTAVQRTKARRARQEPRVQVLDVCATALANASNEAYRARAELTECEYAQAVIDQLTATFFEGE